MRRAKPPGPISPQLLKHFAVVTVALTALLALFASGEDWGAQAQVEAVQAKNQLVAVEAEKLGTKRLAGKLKVSSEVQPGGFGEDSGGFGITNSGGRGTGSAGNSDQLTGRLAVPGPSAAPPPSQLQQPGDTVTKSNMAKEDLPGPGYRKKAGQSGPIRPSQSQLQQIEAASVQRSGGGASGD